jgi:hypothetical protein
MHCYSSATTCDWEVTLVRSKLGYVLTFVGAFLLVVALLATTYAPGRVEKTPIDVDTVTNLAGTATLNGPDGEESFSVLAYNTTKANSAKSDGDVVVFSTSSCVVRDEGGIDGCVSNDDPDERLLTASTDTFAADRVTALAVNDSKYLPAAATPHDGLLNKFPFHVEKKTYPYWDGQIDEAVDAEYVGTEQIDGLDTYHFQAATEDAPTTIAGGADGLYTGTQDVWVDPTTGAFVKVRTQVAQSAEDGSPVLSLDLTYTDQEIQDSADDARANASSLRLLTVVVPVVGFIGGALALLVGLALLLIGRRDRPTPGRRSAATEGDRVKV